MVTMFNSFIEIAASLDGAVAVLVLLGLCVSCFVVAVFCFHLPQYVRISMMVFPVLLFCSVSGLLLVAA